MQNTALDSMKLVIIESPYAGDVKRNVQYARRAMADSLKRGEAPYASHLLFTQVLNDLEPAQRVRGIEAGLAWGTKADLTAVYADYGISRGMEQGIDYATAQGRKIEHRYIGKNKRGFDFLKPPLFRHF